MREKLNSYSTEVAKQIAEADRLCVECADSLSPEQFHLLKVKIVIVYNIHSNVWNDKLMLYLLV
uniref:Uncharacterized protein n=1 Tax=Meloidogyne enterolobii TaxID=390850 RepID=A0A6V7WGC3_MELEN|nr:unnamed protein product [Meloidogyne enterolobii]